MEEWWNSYEFIEEEKQEVNKLVQELPKRIKAVKDLIDNDKITREQLSKIKGYLWVCNNSLGDYLPKSSETTS